MQLGSLVKRSTELILPSISGLCGILEISGKLWKIAEIVENCGNHRKIVVINNSYIGNIH